MKPLHIAVVAFPNHGGSGIVGFESARLLADRGHSVCFVSSQAPLRAPLARGKLEFVTVDELKHPSFSPQSYAWSVAATLLEVHARRPIDVLHVHYAVPHAVSAALVGQTLAVRKPALVATLHGTDVTQYTEKKSHLELTRWALEQCDALIVPSRALQRAAATRFGFESAERCQVIGNFVDLDAFSPGQLVSPPELIHVSNLRRVKRGLDVVGIFARVHEKRPDARLVVVGDGPDRQEMEDHVARHGIAAAVDFAGIDVNVARRLRRASVFVLPSETESFGLAALEAMACGVPVVGSDIGGLPEVVKHGEGGSLLPVGDLDGMASAALRLLDDPALMERQRVAARKRAELIGDPNPILDQYERTYEALSSS